MARIVMTIKGDGLQRFHEAVKTVGSMRKAERAFVRAINRTGSVGGNEAGRALSDQTGLKKTVGKRAYRRSVERAKPGSLSYKVEGAGGDVALKHFKARETRKGVSAAPLNKRQVFGGTFIKGGRFPNRVTLKRGGHVLERVSMARFPIEKEESGVVIPIEMLKGQAAAAFLKTSPRLEARVAHEIEVITKGVVTGGSRRKKR